MKGYFGLGQLSATEKQDILNQHKTIYNGYQTMQPQVSNTQPLYVYDSAGDKEGLVVNNKGEVKRYTNMGINEQVEEEEMCEQCGGQMTEGLCEQCGTSMEGEVEEGTGKLDDIYDEEDLNPNAGFDYIEGSSNSMDTFEKMHKNLYKEDEYEDPDNEDDGFEDIQAGEEMGEQCLDCVEEYETMESAYGDEIDEVDISGSQGIYGDMERPYDFDSNGPGIAGPYQTSSYNEEEIEEEEIEDEMEEVDEDLKEFVIIQKNKIVEMMNRMKIIK